MESQKLHIVEFTSVISTLALRASEFLGSRIKSDVVSPVNATSGINIMSVI
jgi:hypothetical protein